MTGGALPMCSITGLSTSSAALRAIFTACSPNASVCDAEASTFTPSNQSPWRSNAFDDAGQIAQVRARRVSAADVRQPRRTDVDERVRARLLRLVDELRKRVDHVGAERAGVHATRNALLHADAVGVNAARVRNSGCAKMCVWLSMKPGDTYAPAAFTTVAPEADAASTRPDRCDPRTVDQNVAGAECVARGIVDLAAADQGCWHGSSVMVRFRA